MINFIYLVHWFKMSCLRIQLIKFLIMASEVRDLKLSHSNKAIKELKTFPKKCFLQ